MLLNHNIPPVKGFVRKEFLHDLRAHQGELEECVLFGVSSIKGRALGFHAFLQTGAVFYRLPIHAFVWKKEHGPLLPVDHVQTWDQLGYHIAVIEYDFLKELTGTAYLKGQEKMACEYMFTVDFAHPDPGYLNTTFVESPDDHKCQHIVRLRNGQLGAFPNNRLLWEEVAFATKKLEGRPDYKVNTRRFYAETGSWVSSNDDRFFYDLTETTKAPAPEKNHVPSPLTIAPTANGV